MIPRSYLNCKFKITPFFLIFVKPVICPRITPDMRYIHYQDERLIRVYNYVDPRFTLEDMFAKLKLNYGE